MVCNFCLKQQSVELQAKPRGTCRNMNQNKVRGNFVIIITITSVVITFAFYSNLSSSLKVNFLLSGRSLEYTS